MDQEKLDRWRSMVEKVAMSPKAGIDPEAMAQAEAAAQAEREGNQMAQYANILATMTENITGARKGHRLGMREEALNKLKSLQKQAGGGDSFKALLEIYKQGEINNRLKENLARRDKGLGISAEKVDIQKQDKVTDLSKQLNKTGASKLIQKGTHLMDRLEKLSDPKDIPGFGVGQSIGRKVPGVGGLITDAFFTSEEGRDIRGSFQSMLNESIKTFAGSAATVAEVERVMEEVNQGKLNSEEDFLNALERIYSTYENDTQNTLAGYSPEARAKYMKGGGKDLLNQVAGLRSRLSAFRKARAGDKVREEVQTQTGQTSGDLSDEEQKELEELERLEAEGKL